MLIAQISTIGIFKEYDNMKRLLLIGCVFLLLGGCQEAGRNKSVAEVTLEKGSEFPRSLAGAWEANKDNMNYWRIVFKPDGTISSAIIPLGEYEVKPNQMNKTKGPDGEPGFIDAGDFDVFYNPRSHNLAVDIKLKQFYLDLGAHGILKGSWEFLIAGKVSEDEKTWDGNLFNSVDIASLVRDPNSPKDKPTLKEAAKLHIDLGQEEGEDEYLIFTKVVPDANTGSNK
jgi:hypothetical protein